jgi:hypothetical protein
MGGTRANRNTPDHASIAIEANGADPEIAKISVNLISAFLQWKEGLAQLGTV